MKLLIETYKTDDILLKLTIVESIPKMGDSLWNSKFINENLVQNEMIEECFVSLICLHELIVRTKTLTSMLERTLLAL